MRRFGIVASVLALLTMSAVCNADISGFAFVQDDASLRVAHRLVRLFGVYIPTTSIGCRTFQRPVRCAPRAALALEFKIRGFVHCDERGRTSDGGITAVCWTGRTPFSGGEDLGAYLLRKGWAVALPDAPFEYQVLEKIARTRHLGVWGFPLGDSF